MKSKRILFSFLLIVLGSFAAQAEPHDGEPIGKNLFKGGSKKETASPDSESDWKILKCLSDGTCVYENIHTGEQRKRDSKKTKKAESKIEKEAQQAAFESSKSETDLTDEEVKTLINKEIATLVDLKKLLKVAKRAGKDTLVVQVVNLAACPPLPGHQ